MPIQFVEPPPAVLNTYQHSMLDFCGPRDPATKLYHLPVGTIDLATLAKGATLDDIGQSGCRFYAAWPDGTATSCEMTDPTSYGLAEFRNLAQGEAPAAALARIAEAEGLARVQAGSYALHFLSIPGIYLEALHLVNQGEGGDLILPLVSGYSQIPTDAVMDAGAFFVAARAIATARLAQPTSPLSS
jgi:hypothetical protein